MDDKYIDDIFGASGIMSQIFDNYEIRTGQIEMAKMIHTAFCFGRNAAIEGPTGVGKSYAYIVPAAYLNTFKPGSKAVIATSNIALQEQLIHKDLPAIAGIVETPFKYYLLKGRSNFLCNRKLNILKDKRKSYGGLPKEISERGDDFDKLNEWAANTKTGDATESGLNSDDLLWQAVSSSSEECHGKNCKAKRATGCFSEHAFGRANGCDIIVTNYHMLLADASVREATFENAQVLPDYQYLVCDEAHMIETIARDFFGFNIGPRSFYQLINKLDGSGASGASTIAGTLKEAANKFLESLDYVYNHNAYRIRLGKGEPKLAFGDLVKVLEMTAGKFNDVANLHKSDENLQYDYLGYSKRTMTLRGKIEQLATMDRSLVFSIEKTDKAGYRITAKNFVIDELLQNHIYSKATSTVMVSATLAVDNSFDFLREHIGFDADLELVAESPFDYGKQAALIIPDKITVDPSDRDFSKQLAAVVLQTINALNGRTLVLFTSYGMMNSVYEAVKSKTKVKILKQGEGANSVLARQFRDTKESVLFGTNTFWQGLDVQGESLSCLIIDKLPFLPMTDPIVDAIAENNKAWFVEYMVPKAVINLKQGFGRLIRTKSDIGMAIIGDIRLTDSGKAYRHTFLRSLPEDLPFTDNLDEGLQVLTSILKGDKDAPGEKTDKVEEIPSGGKGSVDTAIRSDSKKRGRRKKKGD